MSFEGSGRHLGSDRIVVILLAAGRSQRMGGRNKLLMDADGQPMVRRVAVTLLNSRVREVIAVLGHDHARVAAALAGLPLRIVVNDEYALGQMSSVRAGIAATAEDPVAIVVALADQLALEPPDIDFLIDAFLALPEPKILVPAYRGQRGNPIVLPGMQLSALQAGGANFGCRKPDRAASRDGDQGRDPQSPLRAGHRYAYGLRRLGRSSFVASREESVETGKRF
jgi:molybdenum cofactor cytidylyltransferase